MMKRKICVVVSSRANYGRVRSVMVAIKKHPNLELQLIVGASVVLYRFGKAIDSIKKDGFTPDRVIHHVVEGETLVTQAKSTGLGMIELSTALEDLKPDVVITVADRFETMSTAISAAYLNIPLAHIQGGEISGNIDEKVRHAITKLSDIHFPATEQSKERLIKLGEISEFVFNYGCPGMDTLINIDLSINNELMKNYGGVGIDVDWGEPYLLMMQHPVTTSYGEGKKQVDETLYALKNINNMQKIVLWPNIDAGTDDISKGIRMFREKYKTESFHFFRNFSPEDYARVLKNAKCVIGNSSSFIREGSFLGTPAVIVGDRQIGRESGNNVVYSPYDREEIKKKILSQVGKSIKGDIIFGCGDAGEKIANKLSSIQLNFTKRLTY
jgi:UDP-hydrolysing UDP-N-acetyl-D-glucosamine 2-epimerase